MEESVVVVMGPPKSIYISENLYSCQSLNSQLSFFITIRSEDSSDNLSYKKKCYHKTNLLTLFQEDRKNEEM